MITLEYLTMFPQNIKHLIGLGAEEFETLRMRVEEKYKQNRDKRLTMKVRKRAVGAGRPPSLPFAMRLFAVLMYLRLYIPQRAVAALIHGLSQARLSKDLRELLPIIEESIPAPQLWSPVSPEDKLSPSEYLSEDKLPQKEAIVDVMEQPVYRSKDEQIQKKYYSGKKKRHTVKTQFVVDLKGEIKSVSTVFQGRVHDKKIAEKLDTTWRLPEDCELLGDKAYQGLQKEVEEVELLMTEDVQKVKPRVRVLTPHKKPRKKKLSNEKKKLNQIHGSRRIKVEHSIGKVKNFKICSERFRCDHSIYSSTLRVVCGFVNMALEKRLENSVKTDRYLLSLF